MARSGSNWTERMPAFCAMGFAGRLLNLGGLSGFVRHGQDYGTLFGNQYASVCLFASIGSMVTPAARLRPQKNQLRSHHFRKKQRQMNALERLRLAALRGVGRFE